MPDVVTYPVHQYFGPFPIDKFKQDDKLELLTAKLADLGFHPAPQRSTVYVQLTNGLILGFRQSERHIVEGRTVAFSFTLAFPMNYWDRYKYLKLFA